MGYLIRIIDRIFTGEGSKNTSQITLNLTIVGLVLFIYVRVFDDNIVLYIERLNLDYKLISDLAALIVKMLTIWSIVLSLILLVYIVLLTTYWFIVKRYFTIERVEDSIKLQIEKIVGWKINAVSKYVVILIYLASFEYEYTVIVIFEILGRLNSIHWIVGYLYEIEQVFIYIFGFIMLMNFLFSNLSKVKIKDRDR